MVGRDHIVSLDGAGLQGAKLARRYRSMFNRRYGRVAVGQATELSRRDRSWPAVRIILWGAWDESAEPQLQACARRLERAHGLTLGVRIGEAPSPNWIDPAIGLPATAEQDGLLSAALDCIVAMLIGGNLVNLRVHELRQVVEQGSELRFVNSAVSAPDGAKALLADLIRQWTGAERPDPPKAVWAQLAACGTPRLMDVDYLCCVLQDWLGKEAVVWVGGAPDPAPGAGGLRLSVLAAV
jgi:hypothetical protein